MPAIPTLSPIQTETQPVSMPRMSGENFGAGQWQQIGKAAESGTKISETMNLQNFDVARTQAREALNGYRIGLDKIKSDIQANPENYKNAPEQYATQEAALRQQTIGSLGGKKSMAAGLFTTIAGEHSSQGYGEIYRWQGAMTKRVDTEQAGLSAQLDLKGGDIDNFNKHINTVAALQGVSKDEPELLQQLRDQTAAKAVINSPDENKLELLDSAKKVMSADNWQKLYDEQSKKVLTADGKVASRESKDQLSQLNLMAQESPSKIEKLPDGSFDNMALADHVKAVELQDKVKLGVPVNEYQKTMANIVKAGRKEESPDPKAPADEASAYTVGALQQNKYCFEQLDLLDPKDRTPANMEKIFEQSQKPTLFFDGSGTKLDHAYKAKFADKLQEDIGWWQKQELPKGTVPLESYKGQESEGGYAALPYSTDKYKIYDMKSKKVIDIANAKDINGTAE